jgi:hypothetical protein
MLMSAMKTAFRGGADADICVPYRGARWFLFGVLISFGDREQAPRSLSLKPTEKFASSRLTSFWTKEKQLY